MFLGVNWFESHPFQVITENVKDVSDAAVSDAWHKFYKKGGENFLQIQNGGVFGGYVLDQALWGKQPFISKIQILWWF